MNRRNNNFIQQIESPKSSIEVITRLVVTEKTHDTQMYESHYEEENVEILEGVEKDLKEVVSFTHTYAGEVVDGEHVIAKGKVEKVITEGKEDYFRLVVGTTREAIDEYLKLKIPPA